MLLVGPCDHCKEPSCNSLLWIWTLMLSRANQLLTVVLRLLEWFEFMFLQSICSKANTFSLLSVVWRLRSASAFHYFIFFILPLHSDFHLKNPDARPCQCSPLFDDVLFTKLHVVIALTSLCISVLPLQLGGCGILGVGVWLSVTQGNFATLSSSLPSLSAANLLIAVGAIIMVIGCLGCVGAVKESRPLLLTVNHFEGGLLTLRHLDTGNGATSSNWC